MKRLVVTAILALALTACTTGGGGGGHGTATVPPPSGQVWCLGDSRGAGTSKTIGWTRFVDCIGHAQGSQGFLQESVYGQTVLDTFAALVNQHGLPAKVYISEGVNDAYNDLDARAAAAAFHDLLTQLGVEQVWATSPYTAGDRPDLAPTNVRLAVLNAAMPWAKDCAGADPNLDTVDGVHPSTEFEQAFAACIYG